MDDAGGDDLGLAGTGAGQDQQRALGVIDRLLLGGIEFFHRPTCVPQPVLATQIRFVLTRQDAPKTLGIGMDIDIMGAKGMLGKIIEKEVP
jgi:hypothetical protein